MAEHQSPAVARRRLRLALRKFREARSFTQGEVGRRLEWSLSKVNRIEAGEVAVSGTDLQALLRLYQVTDEAATETMAALGRAARRKGWWDDPQYRPYLEPATIELIQFERDATMIYSFHSTLVPGIVQTRAYAEAIIGFWTHELSDDEISARIEVRLRRRAHVFDQARPPNVLLILDESIVSREVGGPRVMIEQLGELLRHARETRVEIRILPLTQAGFAPAPPFVIVEMEDGGDAILYMETYMSDALRDEPALVDSYRKLVDRMLDSCLSVDASMRLIEAKIAALRSALDRM